MCILISSMPRQLVKQYILSRYTGSKSILRWYRNNHNYRAFSSSNSNYSTSSIQAITQGLESRILLYHEQMQSYVMYFRSCVSRFVGLSRYDLQ